jgi:uncharacterized membrane protein
MTPWEIDQKIAEILAYLTTISLEERQQKLIEKLNAEISDEYIRRSILLVVAANTQITREETMKKMASWEKFTIGAGGAIFLLALLIIALVIPQPSDFQVFVFRLILALAAAAIGAILPGFLEVSGTVKNITLRAGGAIGLFVIVYLLNPPALVHQLQ